MNFRVLKLEFRVGNHVVFQKKTYEVTALESRNKTVLMTLEDLETRESHQVELPHLTCHPSVPDEECPDRRPS